MTSDQDVTSKRWPGMVHVWGHRPGISRLGNSFHGKVLTTAQFMGLDTGAGLMIVQPFLDILGISWSYGDEFILGCLEIYVCTKLAPQQRMFMKVHQTLGRWFWHILTQTHRPSQHRTADPHMFWLTCLKDPRGAHLCMLAFLVDQVDRLIHWFCEETRSECKVLDVGSGDGHQTA